MSIKALFIFSLFSLSASAEIPAVVQNCLTKIPGRQLEVIRPSEAQGFLYYKKGSSTVVQSGKYFWLLSKEKVNCPGIISLKYPVERIITFSTTHLPYFTELHQEEKVLGFAGMELVNNETILKRFKESKVKEMGYPAQAERILALRPEAVFTFAVQKTDEEESQRLLKLGVPLIFVSEYKEKKPLGRAEWLVFMSLFFDQEKEAQKIFNEQKKNYQSLSLKARTQKNKPLVMIGELRGGVWYASGAETDLVRLIEDAGGEYLWKKKAGKSFITLSFEEVLKTLKEAERPVIWFPKNTWVSLKEMEKADPRYKSLNFEAQVSIFNSNLKRNAKGYSDYWETALAKPDLLLKDLVSIFHPSLVTEHKRVWFWDMKKNEK